MEVVQEDCVSFKLKKTYCNLSKFCYNEISILYLKTEVNFSLILIYLNWDVNVFFVRGSKFRLSCTLNLFHVLY